MRLKYTEKKEKKTHSLITILDRWTMEGVQRYHLVCSNHAGWQIKILKLISSSISPTMVISVFTILVIVVLLSREWVKETTWLILCFLPTVATFQLKKITKRERPNAIPLVEEKSASFPSSHATTSTVLLGFVAFLLPNQPSAIAITLGLITAFICYSRIALGVHFLSDVLAGVIWGIICREGMIYLYQIVPQEYYEIGIIWFLLVMGWIFVLIYYKKHPEEIPEILGRKSELIARILTGIVIFLLVILPILKGGWTFLFLMAFIMIEGFLEIITIKKEKNELPAMSVILESKAEHFDIGNLVILDSRLRGNDNQVGTEDKEYLLRIAAIVILIIYVYCCYQLRNLPSGRELLLFVVVTVSLSDVSGYFVGKFFGKRKIFPSLSPGKTWEGTVASILIPTLIATIIFHHQPVVILMAVIATVFGLLGDLLASWFKRKLGAKDFPKILPGHGGLLDRVDSQLLAATIVYLILIIFQIQLF